MLRVGSHAIWISRFAAGGVVGQLDNHM